MTNPLVGSLGHRPRVLVVDDSVVIRRMITEALKIDPGIEVVGTANNGLIALERVASLAPDLVTLDVEMPEMDGLETLAALKQRFPKVRVLMLSTLTQKGAKVTLDALIRGASDYLTKPSETQSMEAALTVLREELLPKVRALCRVTTPLPQKSAPLGSGPQVVPPPRTPAWSGSRKIICIGVSTGGPGVLAELIPQIPANLAVPIVMVQHMPPMFTGLLATRLAQDSAVPVVEAKDGMVLKPGAIALAPGDFHMYVRRDGPGCVLRLDQAEREQSCRPSVDVLFRSVAQQYGSQAVAVVLTGMGKDGQNGCEQLKRAGSYVIAQDEATSIVWGMPGAVVSAGLADKVLPSKSIISAVLKEVGHPVS
jgi:two-component system, chemotaxis family, protein-glutamate methylesterase/glutaminase